jgi:hypothetical protein
MNVENVKLENSNHSLSINVVWFKHGSSNPYIEGYVYCSLSINKDNWMNTTDPTTKDNSSSMFDWMFTVPNIFYKIYFSEKSTDKYETDVIFIPKIDLLTLLSSSANSNSTCLNNLYDSTDAALLKMLVSKMEMAPQPLTYEEAYDWLVINSIHKGADSLANYNGLTTSSSSLDSSFAYKFLNKAIATKAQAPETDDSHINPELMELYSSLGMLELSAPAEASLLPSSSKIGSVLDLERILTIFKNTRESMSSKDFVNIKGFNL